MTTDRKVAGQNAYQATFGPSSEKEGGASVPFARILGKEDFASDLRWVDLCIVKPGAQIGVHEHRVDDEIYYILRGHATMAMNGEKRPVSPGDAMLLRCGGSHGLWNDSTEEVHVLVIDLLVPPPLQEGQRPAWRNIAAVPLTTRPSSVGGIGQIQVGHLFTAEELGPGWDFCEVVIVPAGSTIGVHEHQGSEEIYYFLDGQGVITQDGEDVPFGPDTVSLCRSGSRHGLRGTAAAAPCPGEVPQAPGAGGEVRFLAIQVSLR